MAFATEVGAIPVATDVSTLFVTGIAADATFRELENMVRWFAGYEALKITTSTRGKNGTGAMFVKFDSPDSASQAAKFLHGVAFDTEQPDILMKVEVARAEMKSPAAQEAAPYKGKAASYGYQPPSMMGKGPYSMAPAPRSGKGDYKGAGAVDTLAILGADKAGFAESDLEHFFSSQCYGFLAFKPNSRVGGGFVKFQTPALAAVALTQAVSQGLQAEFARSSMNFGESAGPPAAAYAYAQDSYSKGFGKQAATPAFKGGGPVVGGMGGGGGFKGAGKNLSGGIDTIVLQGVADKGYSLQDTENFFQGLPGFVMWKANNKIGGGFVKFASPEEAVLAMQTAKESGYDMVQMARSSMNA